MVMLVGADGRPIDALQGPSDYKTFETTFMNGVQDAVRAADQNAGARVVAVSDSVPIACGWLTDDEAIEPFVDLGDVTAARSFEHSVLVGRRARGSDRDQIDAAFGRGAILGICRGRMPATPAGFVGDPNLDPALAALWETPAKAWVIVPDPGGAGFVGVARRDGGGEIQTPVFRSKEETQRWIEQPGQALSDALNLRGRSTTKAVCEDKLSAAFGICAGAWATAYSVLPLR
jgi:hypothetical protein